MANVTITKTTQNCIHVDFGDYFPGTTLERLHYFPRGKWGGVCTLRVLGTPPAYEEGVEFHVDHEAAAFMLCYESGQTNFMQVDSVNGVAPVSNEHLIELLVDLIT